MPVLHLDAVPSDVYERIQQRAATRDRTLEAEAVDLLRQGLLHDLAGRPQIELLADLRRRSFTPPAGTPDSVELLREDRER
jgi:plasmid stability protein